MMMNYLTIQLNKTAKIFFTVLVSALVLGFTSCKDDDDSMPEPTDNIMGVVDKTSSVSTLKAAIDAASLRATLQGTGPFTVFAPTNDAFAELDEAVVAYLLATPAELTKVLTYHVVSGKVFSKDLMAGSVASLNPGQSLSVNLSSGVKINDAMVSSPDIETTNGVIHVIDKVLIPGNLDLTGMVPSAAEAAIATSDLSVLVSILTKPALSGILEAAANDDAELTVFAPTNAAFQGVLTALGLTSIDQIPEEVLLDIVKYHIVGAVAKSTDLMAKKYMTLNGESVTVDLTGGVKVDNAKVVTADIEVSNGVVHVIDAVLLPSLYKKALGTIVEVPLFRKDYSILTAALIKADLVNTLLTNGPFTVFAPNNAAFAAAGITSLDGLSKEALTPILLYHVLGAKVLSSGLPSNGVVSTLTSAPQKNFYLSLGAEVYINGVSKITGVDIQKSNGVIHTINRTLIPATQTVVDIAVALSQGSPSQFTTLVGVLTSPSQAAVLSAISDANGAYTVFAPTDAAFAAIANILPTLTNAQISEVLKYHVVAGRIFSTDLSNGVEPTTVKGEKFKVNITSEGVSITDKSGGANAKIIQTNVKGTNGVIHVIDKVLIPTL